MLQCSPLFKVLKCKFAEASAAVQQVHEYSTTMKRGKGKEKNKDRVNYKYKRERREGKREKE